MLEAIKKRLNGKALEPQPVGDALTELLGAKDAACGDLAKLKERRRQALLDDADDKAIDRLERDIERLELRLEKIELAEGPLREQLAAATAAERGRRWEAHLRAHREAAAAFLVAARAAVERHEALVGIMNAARREGFEREAAAAMPATPNIQGNPILMPRALDDFERSLAPAPRSPGRAPRGGVRWYSGQPGSSHYDPTKPPGPPKPTLQHAVVMAPMGNRDLAMGRGPMSAPRSPNDDEPLGPGEVRATVLRQGYEPPDGSDCHVGRRIRLPREIALAAARNGAIEIVEDPTREAVERAGERTFRAVDSLSETHTDPTVGGGGS